MSSPLVSIIIPAYNSERFIAEALHSVIAQKYRPIEVIVVDDGSMDKTAEVVNRCAGLTSLADSTTLTAQMSKSIETNETSPTSKTTEPSLTYLYQRNAGPSAARNTGIKAARGDYIAFLDADDVWLPHSLEQLVEYLELHRDISLVFGDAGSFGPEGVIFESFFNKYGAPGLDERGMVVDAFEKLLEGNFILTGTVLIKKECLDRVGFFDETLTHGEDADLWVRIALFYPIGCIRELLMRRRIHDANTSRNEFKFYEGKLYFLRKIQRKYANEIARQQIDLGRHVLNALRTRIYLFYLRGEYGRALSSLMAFAINYLSIKFFKSH